MNNVISLTAIRTQEKRQLPRILVIGLGSSIVIHGLGALVFNNLPLFTTDPVEVTIIDDSEIPPDLRPDTNSQKSLQPNPQKPQSLPATITAKSSSTTPKNTSRTPQGQSSTAFLRESLAKAVLSKTAVPQPPSLPPTSPAPRSSSALSPTPFQPENNSKPLAKKLAKPPVKLPAPQQTSATTAKSDPQPLDRSTFPNPLVNSSANPVVTTPQTMPPSVIAPPTGNLDDSPDHLKSTRSTVSPNSSPASDQPTNRDDIAVLIPPLASEQMTENNPPAVPRAPVNPSPPRSNSNRPHNFSNLTGRSPKNLGKKSNSSNNRETNPAASRTTNSSAALGQTGIGQGSRPAPSVGGNPNSAATGQLAGQRGGANQGTGIAKGGSANDGSIGTKESSTNTGTAPGGSQGQAASASSAANNAGASGIALRCAPEANCKPPYPDQAQGATGTTLLEIQLANDGQVSDAQIAQSSGNSWFDQAAIKAAPTMRFMVPAGNQRKFKVAIKFRPGD